MNLKSILQYLFFVTAAAGLTYYAVKDIPFSEVEKTWNTCDKRPIWLSGVAVMLSHWFRALRWNLALKPLGYQSSTINSYLSILVGYAVNIGVPRGGEVARCVTLQKLEGVPVKTSVGTVISERIIDVVFLALMMGIAFFVKFNVLLATIQAFQEEHLTTTTEETGVPYLKAGFVLFLIGLSLLIFKSKNKKIASLRAKIKDFLQGMKEGIASVLKLDNSFLFIIYSIAIWVLYFLMAYIVIQAFKETSVLGLEGALMVLVLGSLAMAMPMPGGTGSYHVFVPFGLDYIYKIAQSIGKPFAIIFHAWQTIIHLIVGIIAFVISQIIIKYGNSKKSS